MMDTRTHDEPVIGIVHDLNKDTGKWFVAIYITGFETEQQAVTAASFAQKNLCGKEIITS